jgi:hypothetical protein
VLRALCHSSDILEDEGARAEFVNQPQIVEDQFVPRVAKDSMADQGEALARGASDDHINHSTPDSSGRADVVPCDVSDVSTNDRRLGEVQSMRCRMYRIVLDCRDNIESSLFETERQAAHAGEEVDARRARLSNHGSLASLMKEGAPTMNGTLLALRSPR